MDRIEECLWNDYTNISDIINVIPADDKRKDTLMEMKEQIMRELIKFKQSMKELEIREKELYSENKRDKTHNIISVTTFSVSVFLSLYTVNKTFRFDQDATITSTLGRNILNNMIPKLFKR